MGPGRPIRIDVTHGQRSRYREHTPYREHDYYRAAGQYTLFVGATSRHSQATEWGNRTSTYAALGTAMQLQRKVVSDRLARRLAERERLCVARTRRGRLAVRQTRGQPG